MGGDAESGEPQIVLAGFHDGEAAALALDGVCAGPVPIRGYPDARGMTRKAKGNRGGAVMCRWFSFHP